MSSSLLEETEFSSPDSLNGALCDIDPAGFSPFSGRKAMFNNEEVK